MTDDERGRDSLDAWRLFIAMASTAPTNTGLTNGEMEEWADRIYENRKRAAMREGEQKQKGEARAAGDHDLIALIHRACTILRTIVTDDEANIAALAALAAARVTTLEDRAIDADNDRDEAIRDATEAQADVVGWHGIFAAVAEHLGCQARGTVTGNDHVLERARYLSSMFTGDAYTATIRAEKERDEARGELADAKATIAHWKHLACDPQTRENINAGKVAECERLWAIVEAAKEMRTWIDVADQFTSGDEKTKAAARFDEALTGRTGA